MSPKGRPTGGSGGSHRRQAALARSAEAATRQASGPARQEAQQGTRQGGRQGGREGTQQGTQQGTRQGTRQGGRQGGRGKPKPELPAGLTALPRQPRPARQGITPASPAGPASRVEVSARAKINLLLAVGPRRDDGYHEVSTVMQTVDLADSLVLQRAEASSVAFLAGPGYQGPLPEPPDLVARALGLAAAELPHAVPAAAEVTKQIPMAAGLAGGSADAAAALLGADALAGGSTSGGQLEALCRRLGADIAFCLRGGTALAHGRGDQLASMACRHRIWWVLGISEFPLSTADVYRRFDEIGGPDPRSGGLGRPNKLADALAAGYPKAIAAALRNDLEAAAFDLAPVLAERKQALRTAGAVGVILSGSGPTIAGICRDEAHAEEVAARAEATFARVEVVASTPIGAEVVAREP